MRPLPGPGGIATALLVAALAAEPSTAGAEPPTPATNQYFVVADYIASTKVYNEFSPGNVGAAGSYSVRAAVELPAFGMRWMLEGDYRSYTYPHYSGITPAQFAGTSDGNPCPHAGLPTALTPAAGQQGCVTVLGLYGQFPVPAFTVRDTDYGGRLGVKIAEPFLYLGIGYVHREQNHGYPKQDGFGFGAERLPNPGRRFSAYGSAWYYPSISGHFMYPPGAPASVVRTSEFFRQRLFKYQVGGTLRARNSAFFVDAGILGDAVARAGLSPSGASHVGGYLGLGVGSRLRAPR